MTQREFPLSNENIDIIIQAMINEVKTEVEELYTNIAPYTVLFHPNFTEALNKLLKEFRNDISFARTRVNWPLALHYHALFNFRANLIDVINNYREEFGDKPLLINPNPDQDLVQS